AVGRQVGRLDGGRPDVDQHGCNIRRQHHLEITKVYDPCAGQRGRRGATQRAGVVPGRLGRTGGIGLNRASQGADGQHADKKREAPASNQFVISGDANSWVQLAPSLSVTITRNGAAEPFRYRNSMTGSADSEMSLAIVNTSSSPWSTWIAVM